MKALSKWKKQLSRTRHAWLEGVVAEPTWQGYGAGGPVTLILRHHDDGTYLTVEMTPEEAEKLGQSLVNLAKASKGGGEGEIRPPEQ